MKLHPTLLIILLCFSFGNIVSAKDTDTTATIGKSYEDSLERIEKERVANETKFLKIRTEQLQALKKLFMDSGLLDESIFTDDLLKNKKPKGNAPSKVAAMLKSYENAVEGNRVKARKAICAAHKVARGQLEDLKKTLLKNGDLNGAKAVHEFLLTFNDTHDKEIHGDKDPFKKPTHEVVAKKDDKNKIDFVRGGRPVKVKYIGKKTNFGFGEDFKKGLKYLRANDVGNLLEWDCKLLAKQDFVMEGSMSITKTGGSAAAIILKRNMGKDYIGLDGKRGTIFTEGTFFGKTTIERPTPIKEGVPFTFSLKRKGDVLTLLIDGAVVLTKKFNAEVSSVSLSPHRSQMRVYNFSVSFPNEKDETSLIIEKLTARKFIHRQKFIYTFKQDMTFKMAKRFGTYEILDNGNKLVLTWKSDNNRKDYGTISDKQEIKLGRYPLLPMPNKR